MRKTRPCSSCGAKIIDASQPGKEGTIPLNARRARAYVLDESGSRPVASQVVVALDEAESDLFFVSHFLTCPHASEHSKSKKPRARSAPKASEARLQEVLDLLQEVEPFFERGDEDPGDRFKRVVLAHYADKGHGCDREALRAWMQERAARVRAILEEEGRALFVGRDESEGVS